MQKSRTSKSSAGKNWSPRVEALNPKLEETEEDEELRQRIAGNTYEQIEDISDAK